MNPKMYSIKPIIKKIHFTDWKFVKKYIFLKIRQICLVIYQILFLEILLHLILGIKVFYQTTQT